ncbi:MAG: hypothetical protein ACI9E5_000703 [Candidatus Omnitrophota bacterium]|jgi:hypothetical protein
MYYFSKTIQASGIILVFIEFIRQFPKLMNFKLFLAGIVIFLIGWIIEHFLLRK